MSASIPLAGSVGERSVKARQSAARPRYQSALDVVSLCTLIRAIPQSFAGHQRASACQKSISSEPSAY
jgi:hypothetical protein